MEVYMEIDVKIKYVSDMIGQEIKPPFYATAGAAGMDLSAAVEEDILLPKGKMAVVQTGIAISLPNSGYVAVSYTHLIIDYVRPYFGRMSLGLFIKFIGTIMDLFLPYILAFMIDDVVPKQNVKLILFWGGMMVLCAVVAVVGNVVANRMASKLSLIHIFYAADPDCRMVWDELQNAGI